MGDLTRLMTTSPQTRPTPATNPQRHGHGRGKHEGRWKRTAEFSEMTCLSTSGSNERRPKKQCRTSPIKPRSLVLATDEQITRRCLRRQCTLPSPSTGPADATSCQRPPTSSLERTDPRGVDAERPCRLSRRDVDNTPCSFRTDLREKAIGRRSCLYPANRPYDLCFRTRYSRLRLGTSSQK